MIDIVSEINKNLAVGVVTEYSQIAAELEKLRNDYGSVVPDCTTREGYEFSKNAALTCRDIRTNLENVRKEKKQPYLDYSRLIDSQAKEIKESLEAIENPHKEAYQAVDARKKAELEARKQLIADMNNIRMWAADKSEDEISEKIEEISNLDVSKEAFGRLLDDAIAAQATAIESLYACHAEAVNRRLAEEQAERDRLELEALRAKEAERLAKEEAERQQKEQAERDQLIAKQAAERAEREKAEAEQRAIAAEREAEEANERARLAAIEAEKQSKLAAEQAAQRAREEEQRRIAEEQEQERAEAEAREKDKKHRSAINNAVAGALIAGGLTEEQAVLATKLIAARKVPHVSIQY